MKMRAWLLAVGALWLSSKALGLANAPTLQEANSAARKAQPAKAAIYEKLLKATGYVRMVDSDPLTESRDNTGKTVIRLASFGQSGCSFVHYKAPAFLVGSAVCFADGEGNLDQFRRYAKVFMNDGKAFDVDVLSIVIHPDFKRKDGENDLVVFSVEASQEKQFDDLYTPIDIIPASDWVLEGQTVTMVGAGAKGEGDESFGISRVRDFYQSYPDAEDLTKAQGKLTLSPAEKLLTYRTRDGAKGINCLGDSGGGIFAEVNRGAGETNRLYLQSLILGKVNSEGVSPACEQTDRYLVALDLRHYGDFLETAPKTIEGNRVGYLKLAEAQKAALKIYNPPLYTSFQPMRAEEIHAEFDRDSSDLNAHERNKRLHAFMQREEKRRLARSTLAGSNLAKVAAMTTGWYVDEPADPWLPVGKNWVPFERTARTKEISFTNLKGNDALSRLTIRNIGAEPVSFKNWSAQSGYGTIGEETAAITLKPGQATDIYFTYKAGQTKYQNWTYPISSLVLQDFKGTPNLRIDGLLASQQQQAQVQATLNQISAHFAAIRARELEEAADNAEFVDGQAPQGRTRGVPVYFSNSNRYSVRVEVEYLPVGGRQWKTASFKIPPTGGKKDGPYFYTNSNFNSDAEGYRARTTTDLTPGDRWFSITFD